MRGEAGYTLIELLVAAALLLMLTAVTCQVLLDARATIDVSTERADVQQRAQDRTRDADVAHSRRRRRTQSRERTRQAAEVGASDCSRMV